MLRSRLSHAFNVFPSIGCNYLRFKIGRPDTSGGDDPTIRRIRRNASPYSVTLSLLQSHIVFASGLYFCGVYLSNVQILPPDRMHSLASKTIFAMHRLASLPKCRSYKSALKYRILTSDLPTMALSSESSSSAAATIPAPISILWLLLVALGVIVVRAWIAMSQILTFIVLAIIAPHPAGKNLPPLLITMYWVPDVGRAAPLFLLSVLFAVIGAEGMAGCLLSLAVEAVELAMMALVSGASMIYVGCLAAMHAYAWICTVAGTVESMETPRSTEGVDLQSPNLHSPDLRSSNPHSQHLHSTNPPSGGRKSWKRRRRA